MTPEQTYESANVVGYNYRRTSTNGLGMLLVEIMLNEVRVTATADFSTTKKPSGADAVDNGTEQTKAPTPAQNQSVLSGLMN